ncbi:hypothetical protein BD309DRAFT_867375, partial [Dichomitus squalens]
AFHDVTNGANRGCQTAGFVAAPGWDPVTGWTRPTFLYCWLLSCPYLECCCDPISSPR